MTRANNKENMIGYVLLYIIVEEKNREKNNFAAEKMKFILHKNITNEKMSSKNGI